MPAVSRASADTADSSAVAAAAVAVATAPEGEQLVTQQGADPADCGPSCTADDWNWQQSQSQANLGFQDAFEATQGFGVTPDVTPVATWAAPKPAAQPPIVSSLPITAGGQAKAQEKLPAAKHVPFSTRRVALPSTKPETKQCTAVPVQQPNCEFLNVRRPLPKQQRPQSSQRAATAEASAQSHGAGSAANRQGSWSPQAASVPWSQMVTLPATHAQALAVCDSHARHNATTAAINATAAVTHHVAQGTSTHATAAYPEAQNMRAAGLQAQTARAEVANLNSGHNHATATASGKATLSSKSTAAAARGRSPSPAGATVAATSPAAAIFGPHIAEPVCSQSHAKKKLCLRLAPRQAEPTAAGSSTAVVVTGLHQAGSSSQAHQQPQAEHGLGAAAATTAGVCLAQSSSAHQQNRGVLGEVDGRGDGKRDGQVKGPGNEEAACTEAKEGATTSAVISLMDSKVAIASPEAATPTGQPD